MSDRKIKWAGLQMLTGGFYLGAESAIGHPAEFIISYPGFDAPKYNKDGELVDAGNEYNLIKYLENHNRMVPYYQFDRKPFETDMDKPVKLLKDGVDVEHPDYSGIDLVVAVPVCSGLSSATLGASNETLMARNCNMMFLAKYTLSTIKPKVYIFENAPRLVSANGIVVRKMLEKIASDYNYSVIFYKTDSALHDNCQKRPRTFVYFFKNDADHIGVPNIGFESNHVSAVEFLSRVPKDATLQEPVTMTEQNNALIDFAKHLYGDDWRNRVKSRAILIDLLKNEKLDEWMKFSDTLDYISDKTKHGIAKYVKHIYRKRGDNKGFYVVSPIITTNDSIPAAMFKTIPYVLHPKEDRLLTIREWLSLMGMPYDFEMYGKKDRYFPKIGQNVPARTAQFIVGEAIKVINSWDTFERFKEHDVMLFDNTKQSRVPIDK